MTITKHYILVLVLTGAMIFFLKPTPTKIINSIQNAIEISNECDLNRSECKNNQQ